MGGGGGGGGIFSICCLISNTLPLLEQSSFLHPSTVLHHRLLLHTTCINYLRLLLHLISSKEKQKQQQASQKGLRPFNPQQKSIPFLNSKVSEDLLTFNTQPLQYVPWINKPKQKDSDKFTESVIQRNSGIASTKIHVNVPLVL